MRKILAFRNHECNIQWIIQPTWGVGLKSAPALNKPTRTHRKWFTSTMITMVPSSLISRNRSRSQSNKFSHTLTSSCSSNCTSNRPKQKSHSKIKNLLRTVTKSKSKSHHKHGLSSARSQNTLYPPRVTPGDSLPSKVLAECYWTNSTFSLSQPATPQKRSIPKSLLWSG